MVVNNYVNDDDNNNNKDHMSLVTWVLSWDGTGTACERARTRGAVATPSISISFSVFEVRMTLSKVTTPLRSHPSGPGKVG